MRLRRETGDYSIAIVNRAATIPAHLNAEDLIGAIVVDGTATAVVTAITTASTTLSLTAGAKTYTYTIATGAISAPAGN